MAPVVEKLKLFIQLVWENTKLGPFVQLRMLMAALPWTLYGISKAGARASIAAVDSERQATVAAIACTLAKLGFPATVASMTHEIVAADRADAAVKISMEGMTAGYMVELTQITNEMLAAGYYSDASEIAKASAEHGHSEMLKLLATDGPLQSVTKPINDAVEWITGSSGKQTEEGAEGRDAVGGDGEPHGHGGEPPAEEDGAAKDEEAEKEEEEEQKHDEAVAGKEDVVTSTASIA